MMGRRSAQASLFHQFRLDDRVPKDHLLRRIDRFVTPALADIHERLHPYYSEIGRPSFDPELMIRMLVVGYCYGLRSAAQPLSPAYQPDSMITQARMGCGAGMVMVNGACVTRTTMRHARRCARWNGGVSLTTIECSVISFKEESDMRKIALTGAIIVCCAAFSASPLSINWSATQKSFTLSQDKAVAAVGKPLSAGSVAGVHRRQERRQHHQNTTAPK
jgi:transposase